MSKKCQANKGVCGQPCMGGGGRRDSSWVEARERRSVRKTGGGKAARHGEDDNVGPL